MIDHGDDDDDEDYHFEKYYDSEKYNDNDNNFTGLAYMAALCSYRGSLNPARALGPAFVANRFFLMEMDVDEEEDEDHEDHVDNHDEDREDHDGDDEEEAFNQQVFLNSD